MLILNKKAKRFVELLFSKLAKKDLDSGSYFYHGARSLNQISSMRHNAMLSPCLKIGVNYAFKRDYHRDELYRALFCCTLATDVTVKVIVSINWNKFHSILNKYDSTIPLTDFWLQNCLVPFIKAKYGSSIAGVFIQHTNEFIFDNSSKRLNVHRVIR